jgi:hypothetical protein
MEARPGLTRLMFDAKAGRYLRQSMTDAEITCLKAFSQNIEQRSISQGVAHVTGDVWVVHTCNHIIEITLTSAGSGVVRRIYRDVSSSLPAEP